MTNLNYQTEINRLKELKALDENKYIAERELVAEKYKKSIRTIQRDMTKSHLARKQRSDSGKLRKNLSDKEKAMITEIRSGGKSKKQAVKIVEEKSGKKISHRVASRTEPVVVPSDKKGKPTMFAEEAKKFFEQFFEYDLIAPENGIPFKYKKVSFILDKEHCQDIILSFVDAYNKSADEANRLQLDRKQYMRAQIFLLLSYQVNLTKISGNITDLDRIVRMYQKMEIDYGSLSPDLDVLIKICRAVKPDITEDEIFSLIKKFSNG